MNGMNSLNRQTGRWAGRYRAGGQAGRQTHSQFFDQIYTYSIGTTKDQRLRKTMYPDQNGRICIFVYNNVFAHD